MTPKPAKPAPYRNQYQENVMRIAISDYAKQILELQNKKTRAEQTLKNYLMY